MSPPVPNAAECSASALFLRPELEAVPAPAEPEPELPVTAWTSISTEHHRRGVARLATAAPGSDSESGLIDLGPWPGGMAANHPRPDPMRPSLAISLRDGPDPAAGPPASDSYGGRPGLRGMDPIGLTLLATSFMVLTVVAGLLAHAALF